DFHVTGVQTCALPILRPLAIGLVSTKVEARHGVVTARPRPEKEPRAGRIFMDRIVVADDHPLFRAALRSAVEKAAPGAVIAECRSEERRVGKEWRRRR